jgi:hypothetical protein
MKSSELVDYLRENGRIDDLKKRIAPALKEFSDGLQVKGGSAPIILTIENKDIYVGSDEIKRLCMGYLDRTLNAIELGYVASAFDICPDFKFEADSLKEMISELSDSHMFEAPEVDKFVKTVVQSLENKNA